MKISCYLKVQAKKNEYRREITDSDYFIPGSLTVTKSKPNTSANEIAVKLDIEIPNSLFVKPTLNFEMTIPEDSVAIPVLNVEAQQNLAELLSEQIGQRVHLSVSADDVED